MRPLLMCAGVVILMVLLPVLVAFTLWCKDRRDEEKKGYWDVE